MERDFGVVAEECVTREQVTATAGDAPVILVDMFPYICPLIIYYNTT